MIFDSINNKENYREYPTLYKALCFLTDLEGQLPAPNTVIEEGYMFCNPVSLVSKPEEQCIYEAHRIYADLHFIVRGREGIATADVKEMSEKVPYDNIKDIAFYEGEASGKYVLKQGDFMVCYPSDAHKVAMMEKEPEEIDKIVIKIKMQIE
ncbi:YhcH/YjgK/YiaL family protein [Mediterraneibacter agrestimuris]|uniref:YhcH/YjgK/YiaL family protein n=1 Tax=Mediterraneibacter agrestimuris TaxID=2941333 RepID=UPI002040D311|nr:YhcH/YjgK/YiaL family protein [Mediterraneibacter agrestimuris]